VTPAGKKNVFVVLNGICHKKKLFYKRILPALSEHCNVEVSETIKRKHAETLALLATAQQTDVIMAAGGDGTLNEVVNGVLSREGQKKYPVIGVIPIGSGNDFARAAGLTADVRQLKELFTRFEPRKVDIGQVQFTDFHNRNVPMEKSHYFVNVADIGMGPMVVARLMLKGKLVSGGIAYYQSILSTFLTYRPMVVKAVTDDWRWEGRLRTLGVANGKCYGHGLYIAPDALPDDRKFSVFICGNVSVFDFIRHTSALKKGRHIHLPEVHYKETTSIELSTNELCGIEADGEILGVLPARVSLVERQLDFLI
jgi:diacylglycerol kinase (ATP)